EWRQSGLSTKGATRWHTRRRGRPLLRRHRRCHEHGDCTSAGGVSGRMMNRCSTIFVPLVLLFIGSGCNDIGFIADKFGPGTTDAKFVPPKWTMVVIAENWRSPAGNAIDSQQLAQFVYDDLRKHDVAPQIDPSAVTELQSRRS